MLVDSELVKEKLAKLIECGCRQLLHGKGECQSPGNCSMEDAAAIRQTDLTDCRVEEAHPVVDRLRNEHPQCHMVVRDSECDPPEFFRDKLDADDNARLGVCDTHVYPLYNCSRLLLVAADLIESLSAQVADLKRQLAENAASTLIDAWCSEHGGKISWAKAIKIVAIVTKQDDAERDRLLHLGDNNGSCEMCGRNAIELERQLATEREHVAWLRYNDHNGVRPTTIHLCDSDAPGAFKVYRRSLPTDGEAG